MGAGGEQVVVRMRRMKVNLEWSSWSDRRRRLRARPRVNPLTEVRLPQGERTEREKRGGERRNDGRKGISSD